MRRYTLYNNIHCIGRFAAAANSFVVVVIAIGVSVQGRMPGRYPIYPTTTTSPQEGLWARKRRARDKSACC